MRLGLISVSLFYGVGSSGSFMRQAFFGGEMHVECGLILPSDYLQLYCMTCLYRTYAVGSIKMK